MTPFTYPLPTEYRDPAVVYPARWRERPIEGDRVIPLAFDWGVSTCFHVNVTYISTQPFNQIVAAFIDNIKNDVDIQIYCPDTNFVLTVPAASSGLYPLTTGGKDFYIVGVGAVAGNFTRMQLFNSYPYPIAVEKTDFVTARSSTAGSPIGSSSTALIPAGVNGLMTAAQIIAVGVTGGAAAGEIYISLQDGNVNNIAQTGLALAAAQVLDQRILLDLTGVAAPFKNGLNLIVLATGTNFVNGGGVGGSAALITNLYTR